MSAVRYVPLGKVATIARETVEAQDIRAGSLYVGLENIEPGGRFVNVRGVENGELASNKFKFTANHVLYGKLRPYLAKVARPDFAGICSTDIVPVLPGPDVDRRYLAWMLLSPRLVAVASSRASGANLPRISPHALASMEIPLVPLSEQRRIAEILDKADALRAKRRAALAQLDTLTQSIFVDMFGDPATNPKAWRIERLCDLGNIKTGGTPPTDQSGMFNGPIPFMTPGDLDSDAPAKRTVTAEGANAAETAEAGATLVCCIGATIGKIRKASERTAFNQQINAIEWHESVDADYGFSVMRLFKPTIIAWGTSTTLPILKKSTFERIEIPVPPVEAQRTFAGVLRRVERLRGMTQRAQRATDELFHSLQTRAFRGEL